jgi:hypothetical protein
MNDHRSAADPLTSVDDADLNPVQIDTDVHAGLDTDAHLGLGSSGTAAQGVPDPTVTAVDERVGC